MKMKPTKRENKYLRAVKTAKAASSAVKDPELAYVAFELVLAHLLKKKATP